MGKCQECGGVDGHLPPCSEAMDREQAVAYLRRQLAAANERAGRLETKLASVRRYVEARAGCMTTDAYDKGRDSVCAGVIERLDEEVPDAL